MAKGEKILHKDIIQEGNPFEVLINAIKEVLKLLEEVKKAAKGNSFLTGKDFKDAEKSQIELAIATEKLTKLQEQNNKMRIKAKELAEQQERLAKDELGTLEKLAYQNKQLTAERKKLNLETKAGKERLQQINSQLDQNNKVLRQNSDQLTKQKINIGNYSSALKGLGGSLLRLASGLGIAVGGFELFKKVIASTDSISDAFARNLSGVNEAVGFLGRAISTMDFTNLISGMREAFEEGKRYANVLDEIEDRQRALGIQKGEIEGQIIDQRAIAKNRALDVATRRAAIDEIVRLEQLKLDKTKTITTISVNNELERASKIAKIRQDEVADFVKNYDLYLEKIKQGEDLTAQLNTVIAQATKVQTDRFGNIFTTEDTAKVEAWKNSLTDAEKEAMKFYEVNKILTKEIRDNVAAALNSDIAATNELKSANESLTRIKNGLIAEYLKEEVAINNNVAAKQEEANSNIAISRMETIEVTNIDTRKVKILTRNSQDYTNWVLQNEQDIRDSIQQTKEARIYAAQETANFIGEIGNMMYSMEQQNLNNEMQDAETLRDYKVALAGDDAKKRTAAEREYQAKAKEIRKKEAKTTKEQAIFNASINLAQAIARAFGDFPFPAAAIFAALSAVLAGAQLAAIIAQPLPSFRKGLKRVTPDNLAPDKDGRLVQVHKDEGILTAKTNMEILNQGVEHNQIPGLVYMGKKYNSEFPILAEIAEKQLREQQRTNGLMKKWGYIDKNGNFVTLDGNKVAYV